MIKLKGEKEKSKFGWRLQYSFFYQLTENKQRYRRIQQPINQKNDLIYIYRKLHQITTANTFLTRAQGMYNKVDHILGTQHYLNLKHFKPYRLYFLTTMESNQKSIRER